MLIVYEEQKIRKTVKAVSLRKTRSQRNVRSPDSVEMVDANVGLN